jgi:serum/glucocorticoid-regulated kinase 2
MLKTLGLRKQASSATITKPSPPAATSTLPPMSRTGLLTIRVLWAEDLGLPAGISTPPAVQAALSSQQAKVAAAVSPSSVNEQRQQKHAHKKGNRDSVQRAQCWWLPYLVMEFDVNQVLITSLGGDITKPLYMYQAHL